MCYSVLGTSVVAPLVSTVIALEGFRMESSCKCTSVGLSKQSYSTLKRVSGSLYVFEWKMIEKLTDGQQEYLVDKGKTII